MHNTQYIKKHKQHKCCKLPARTAPRCTSRRASQQANGIYIIYSGDIYIYIYVYICIYVYIYIHIYIYIYIYIYSIHLMY